MGSIMSLGLGIFLSSLFLGTVYLYVNTRDRWKWRRIVKWVFAGLGSIALLLGGALAYELLTTSASAANNPAVATSLGGVRLGERYSDVVFRLGEFQLDSEKAPEDDASYSREQGPQFGVRNGLVSWIWMGCKQFDYTSGLNGIACEDTSEKISEKLGTDVRIQCYKKLDDEKDRKFAVTVRAYDYPQYGIRFYLAQNKVGAFRISSPEALAAATNKNWGKCD